MLIRTVYRWSCMNEAQRLSGKRERMSMEDGRKLRNAEPLRILNLVEDTAGARSCEHEHGLSFYIETKKHKLLMDCGATDMFLRNAQALGVDLTQVDTVILSHGHYDHGGGILPFAALNPAARIYLRTTAGEAYYHLTSSGEKYIGIDPAVLCLKQCVMVEGDLKIDDELYLFTNIAGRKYPAKSNEKLKKKADGQWLQDTFDHEQCLAVTCGEKRILMSGCAHSGIVNILDRYRTLFHDDPDVAVSGFHLIQREPYSEEEEETIRRMARKLAEKKTIFYTGHCTGQAAYELMKESMGDRLRLMHSGEEIAVP